MTQDTTLIDTPDSETPGFGLVDELEDLLKRIDQFETLLDDVVSHTRLDPSFIERNLTEAREMLEHARDTLAAWRAFHDITRRIEGYDAELNEFDAGVFADVEPPRTVDEIADDLDAVPRTLHDAYVGVRDYEEESGIPCHWRNDINQLAETPVADRAESLVDNAKSLADTAERLAEQVSDTDDAASEAARC